MANSTHLTLNDLLSEHNDVINEFLKTPSALPRHLQQGNNSNSEGELPDNEKSLDLVQFFSTPDGDIADDHMFSTDQWRRDLTSNPHDEDPFLAGSTGLSFDNPFPLGLNTSFSNWSLDTDEIPGFDSFSSFSFREDMTHKFTLEKWLEDSEPTEDKSKKLESFSGWMPLKVKDEPDDDYMSSKNWGVVPEDTEFAWPNTQADSPSASGDDSDVDIETVTDVPGCSDMFGYNTRDSLSPPVLQSSQKIQASILPPKFSNLVVHPRGGKMLRAKLASTTQPMPRSLSLKSQIDSSTGRSSSTQKRKLGKEKKVAKVQTQPAYTQVLYSSSSVNFHDYAMSPSFCASPSVSETAKPTVLPRRVYRRNTALDGCDKEKQNHHNQLERNRRQKLADLFTELRDEVPKITGNAKASKVLILKESATYIRDLQRKTILQDDEISREMRRKELLRNQLRQMQAKMRGHVK